MGLDAVVLEADDDLGGTWFRNRYPGARFDSESYTYGYSWSQELLDEWHWTERFSPQPETLRYLNFVAERFDLRRFMRFGERVASMVWNEDERIWTVTTTAGVVREARWVITGVGVLSVPTLPRIKGVDDFTGVSFHTHAWPADGLDRDKRVGVIGTGATAIQLIGALAPEVGELTVFQRRPNWSVPLNNSEIDEAEMAEIRSRYEEIFANCAITPGGFEHVADRGFDALTPEERRKTWDQLYDEPGFALLLANFPETFFQSAANQELSNYVADRIRGRVDDPEVAEKLIPRDHGFGMQRLPLETNYFEAYNRPNVHLCDASDAAIERITPTGVETISGHHELDVIVYATGYGAITGALGRIDIRGVNGQALQDLGRRPQHASRHRLWLPEPADGWWPPKCFWIDKDSAPSRPPSTGSANCSPLRSATVTPGSRSAPKDNTGGLRRSRRRRAACRSVIRPRVGSPGTTPTSRATGRARSAIRRIGVAHPASARSSKRPPRRTIPTSICADAAARPILIR